MDSHEREPLDSIVSNGSSSKVLRFYENVWKKIEERVKGWCGGRRKRRQVDGREKWQSIRSLFQRVQALRNRVCSLRTSSPSLFTGSPHTGGPDAGIHPEAVQTAQLRS